MSTHWIVRAATPLALLLSVACLSPARLGPVASVFAVEPSGSILVSHKGDLWIIENGRSRQFTKGGTWRQPSWSPDGQRFAYVYRVDNFSEIFVMNRDGSQPMRLTASQSPILQESDWAFDPAWSPDGARIAFTSDATSYNPMLWVMNADGSGKRQLSTAAQGIEAVESPDWAPDGESLIFTGFRGGIGQIYRYWLASGEVEQITQIPGGALDPAWSPDGRLIAFVAREDDQTRIHISAPDGSSDTRIGESTSVRAPTWSPDGQTLAFLCSAPGQFELYLVSLDTASTPVRWSSERQITSDLDADAASGMTWTR